jgi:anti-sigma-K factor RskA
MSPAPDELGPDAASFDRVFDLGASLDLTDFEQVDPPADLWDRIAAQLDTPEAGTPAELTVLPDPDPTHSAPRDEPDDANLVALDERRRSRWARVAAAAAVVVIAASTVGVVMSNQDGTDQEVVASVDLEVLQGDASGEVELVRVDGEQRLVLSAEGMAEPPEGRHYELWLIDDGITAPQSLGEVVLADGSVSVVVPEGIDPDEFPIVDVNLQEDGVEEHSGLDTSVLRGSLA